jgi:hypothetical protein
MVSLSGLPTEILHRIIIMACMSDLQEEGIYQSVADMPQNWSLDSDYRDGHTFPISSATTGPQLSTDLDRHFLAQNGDVHRGPLHALVLTSGQLSSVAAPLLYRWVDISTQTCAAESMETDHVRLFLQSIKRNTALGKCVRSLSMDLPQCSSCFPSLPSPGEYVEILERLPNLRTLILRSHGSSDSIAGAAQIFQVPNLRDNITELSFVSSMEIAGEPVQPLDIKILQAMPQFTKLQTLSIKAIDGFVWLQYPLGTALFGGGVPVPVKEIILNQVMFFKQALTDLFTWFEGLERVHITAANERLRAPDPASGVVRCLLPHRKTLKSATVIASGSFQGLWSHFSALEELGIPLLSFIDVSTLGKRTLPMLD